MNVDFTPLSGSLTCHKPSLSIFQPSPWLKCSPISLFLSPLENSMRSFQMRWDFTWNLFVAIFCSHCHEISQSIITAKPLHRYCKHNVLYICVSNSLLITQGVHCYWITIYILGIVSHAAGNPEGCLAGAASADHSGTIDFYKDTVTYVILQILKVLNTNLRSCHGDIFVNCFIAYDMWWS